MIFGRVKASAKKIISGYSLFTSWITHSQKRNRFSMRIIDSENVNTLINPIGDNGFQFIPQCLPVFRFKIKGIDILIFFRWIFCILNRSIRALLKPVRMFLYIRMIRRALKRNVKSDINIILSSLRLLVFYNRQGYLVRVKWICVLPHHFRSPRENQVRQLQP